MAYHSVAEMGIDVAFENLYFLYCYAVPVSMSLIYGRIMRA